MIAGTLEISRQVAILQINEDDLTFEKLREFQSQLQELEKEKGNRLEKVIEHACTAQNLCTVFSMESF